MPRCSRCVSVWGKKKGVGIGHNARNKKCPAIEEYCKRTAGLVPIYNQSVKVSERVEEVDEVEENIEGCEEGICSICMGRKSTHAFFPCFHQCVCEGCAIKVNKIKPSRCPICRKNIVGFGKVRLV